MKRGRRSHCQLLLQHTDVLTYVVPSHPSLNMLHVIDTDSNLIDNIQQDDHFTVDKCCIGI